MTGRRRARARGVLRRVGQRQARLYTTRLRNTRVGRAWRRCASGRMPDPRMCSVGESHVFSFWANVFSFRPDVFTFRANVFTLAGEAFSFRRYALVGDGARKEGEDSLLRQAQDRLREAQGSSPSTGSGQVSGDAGMTGMCPLCQANVSSFLPDVSTFRPNVSTLAGEVSSRGRRAPSRNGRPRGAEHPRCVRSIGVGRQGILRPRAPTPRSKASRGRGRRVLAMTSMPAMQAVHALLALLAGVWFDSSRRGRRPGSPRTGTGRVPPGPLPAAHSRIA